MTNEFTHYSSGHSEHGRKDMDNCGACALLYAGEEGPNYTAWPLSFIENGRSIPQKYYKALVIELERTDNMAYLNNLKNKMKGRVEVTKNEKGDYYVDGVFACNEKDIPPHE